MDFQSIANKLNTSPEAVEKELERRGLSVEQVTTAMLSDLGDSIHGGAIAPVNQGLATVSKSKSSLAPKRSGKAKAAPVVIDPVSVAAAIAQEQITADTLALAQLITPELRALTTVNGGQELSDRISQAMRSQGLSVDSILRAAMPDASHRRSLVEIMDTALEGFDVDAIVAQAVG